jgi:transcription-repair coupling factor (superfamily II helicase)
MALYRRLSEIEEAGEIESFAAELIDRFGPLPDEVKHLLKIVEIKHLCRMAQVEKIDAGPKGATLTFRNKAYPNARGLVRLITEHSGTMRVRPDQTLVVMRDWPSPAARLKGAELLLQQLARLAEAA